MKFLLHSTRIAALLLVLAGSLASGVAAQVGYVIHMTIDSLGGKYLQFFVTNAPARFPNFNRLINEGACTFNARCDYDYSITIPNHVTMFTGRPVLQPAGATAVQHGITTDAPAATATIHNSGNISIPYKTSFFDVAHDY